MAKIASLTIFPSSLLCCNNHWSPERVVDLTNTAKIAKNRKSDDFLRYLRFITVICHVNVHFYRVHDHLKQSRLPILPNLLKVRKVSALCHFDISLSAFLHAKGNAANLSIKVCYLKAGFELYSWDSIVFKVSFYAFFKLGVFEQGINIINVFFNWSKLFIHITS